MLPDWAKEKYLVRLSGYINFPRTGNWKLKLSCDDGAVLWIDGEKFIDINRSQVFK